MKQDPFAPEYKEVIEADAVCNQCGKVNPEGTLICKTCGNNLRDQRMLRLAADQQLQGDEEVEEKRSFLLRALTVLALLILVWLGMNVGRITSALTTAESDLGPTIEVRPYVFWTDEKATYDPLSQELVDNFPTETSGQTARVNAAQEALTDGLYALFTKNNGEEDFAGGANLEVENNQVRFVARSIGGTEIRGVATLQEDTTYASSPEQVGIQQEQERYVSGWGNAEGQADGGYQITVYSSDWRGVVLAYRLVN